MQYRLSCANPHAQSLEIELTLNKLKGTRLVLQLPAWRPGRYELANFAKNVRTFAAFDAQERPLKWEKVAKDRWEIRIGKAKSVTVRYTYYARQMDGGGSWIDETQWYLNFINFALYAEDRLDEPCDVILDVPRHYQVACGMKALSKHHLRAENYYQLVDSPLIASDSLQHFTYEAEGIPFHVWIQGNWTPDWPQMHMAFQLFSEKQIQTFGEFPEPEYHFLIQALPWKFYHGVEHRNSTAIVLGPDYELSQPFLYRELLGVSSHELYHAWNVVRIRPAEMMPYDFARENYFRTGFVAEGVTTYCGDLFLARAGVFSLEEYLMELNKLLQRHFLNYGRLNLSVADSSFDTWLDGYTPGIPHRKGSIYVEGAVAALILDLELRELTQGERSLDDVMRIMWDEFGRVGRGYTVADYQEALERVAGKKMKEYVDTCLFGTVDLSPRLRRALHTVGLSLHEISPDLLSERQWGVRTSFRDGSLRVEATAPGSPAERVLCRDDELIALNGIRLQNNLEALLHTQPSPEAVELTLFRNHRLQQVTLAADGQTYFAVHQVRLPAQVTGDQARRRHEWLG
ncbi:Predicted metalloprotease, contains C-terminal PDZ domain [Catalinimonas alkaloidigena]|uniref:Predicted metalloprotease, contains C-terminal PDZ domain n=1 Tax=Catalinimonas alkaloidigena TaxID=1075417 RepID=A0A1G9MLX0_9BACT|nr:M61 family metallopeptidase [Catalinimonas alkaloidigena]SDL75260.1 Predicted metalloprotease, contains C-terminal PDZ domain [Catalinimonas alkaloidigena]